ncbi:MAG TPA: hypothetical protein VG944_09665 [Fimbriimonas sp.]|nr:hypothetical protein [Fimbriimonas sp.]
MTIAAILVTNVLILLLLAFSALKARSRSWEYKLEDIPDAEFNDELNQMGSKGWEMIFARRASGGDQDPTTNYEVIFKRPKS